jgi:hypothetical protein
MSCLRVGGQSASFAPEGQILGQVVVEELCRRLRVPFVFSINRNLEYLIFVGLVTQSELTSQHFAGDELPEADELRV